MSFRKREREYEAAERKYRIGLLRITRQAFLIRPPRTPAGLKTINITKELKRPVTKKKLHKITEELYDLGSKHGTELIEELEPKTKSTAASYLAAAEPYNQRLINDLTDHTITNMAYIADDARDELISSLKEGYAEGEGIPALTKRVQESWGANKVRAVRFARTFTNEVYNQAHYNRYQDSPVVDGIQFSAHLDSRTSEQCRMLNMTIWAKGDPSIQHPPLHFNCRSRIIPYFGKIPGERDFRKSYDGVEYSKTDIAKVQKQITVFRSKYWKVPMREVPKIPISIITPVEKINKTLSIEEAKIKGNEFETGIIVDKKTGKVLLTKKGSKNMIAISDSDMGLMKGNILTHNHPGGRSFSSNDIKTMCNSGMAEVRAVGDKYTYVLKIDDATPDMWDNIILHAYKHEDKIQYAQWGPKIRSGEMAIEYGNANHGHEVWKRVFKDMSGMDYTRIEN